MLLYLEGYDDINNFLKSSYKIDLEEDYSDVQELKNKVFGQMWSDAKAMKLSTMNMYKNKINLCGNNKKRRLKQYVASFGKALMRKKEACKVKNEEK